MQGTILVKPKQSKLWVLHGGGYEVFSVSGLQPGLRVTPGVR
jgi:hypothetical protein